MIITVSRTRLPTLLRIAASHESFSRLRLLFSISAATQRARNFFSDDTHSEESAVYKHTLKFQKPSTIPHTPKIHNSVSCIGTVDFPLERINTPSGSFGVHTFLSVSTSILFKPSFKIKLKMWDNVAELLMKHLKQNDLIYVWGHLFSFAMDGPAGNPRVFHEVIVKEFNFVTRLDKASTCQENKKTEFSDRQEMRRSRLHLWQVFFSNPDEWWDNRRQKVNYKGPDFKHKHTGEALWLKQDDPPWVRRQLELQDSKSVDTDSGNLQVYPLTYE
ncbi:unnamed protein product [Cuscuta europaea]|uniref:Protein OSB1, mitochondrial n=1 Tax=Cuscuta europaea TaxID=41803 RepID=A0A9P1DWK6_CUSEU|nr:unnamed protein product [Cuscuta europaea]